MEHLQLAMAQFWDFPRKLIETMVADVDYDFVRHDLEAGVVVPAHVEDVDEYILIAAGIFTLIIGDEGSGNETETKYDLKGTEWHEIHIPEGKKHSLTAHSDLRYFVLKGKKQ